MKSVTVLGAGISSELGIRSHNDDSSDDDDDEMEFNFCLHRDAESGELEALWGDREDDKPDAADVRWLRKQQGRL
ncbi:hypothetical protein ACHAW5_001587 [Stephanodiscus triporus]|uniref:Deacetylase sirtuin-type domain-containing protein n=1 Tax=Stephanodiscus triporus TaxID=2934178 RepID=A0ABD3NJI4_9STRA